MNTDSEISCIQNSKQDPSTSQNKESECDEIRDSSLQCNKSEKKVTDPTIQSDQAGRCPSQSSEVAPSCPESKESNVYKTNVSSIKQYEAGSSSESSEAGPSSRNSVAGPSSRNSEAGPSSRSSEAGPSSRSSEAGPSSRSCVAGSSGIQSNVAGSSGIQSNVAGSSGIQSNVAGSSGIQSNESSPGSSRSSEINVSPKLRYDVQHIYLKWTIESFSAFPNINDKYCLSPIFSLRNSSWLLSFHPKAKICGVDKISINLIRHRFDSGPEKVSVSYRLGLRNYNNKIWFEPEECRIFARGDSYGFQTSILEDLEDFLSDGINNNNDILWVLCEMYVLSEHDSLPSKSIKSIVDFYLPADLHSILRKQHYSDVLIEIPLVHAIRMQAHRAVLCARSKTLARLLGDGKRFIHLCCTHSCLCCVFLFMYTGDFNHLAKYARFTIGLFELARDLYLSKLRDLLFPQTMRRKSKVLFENFKIPWTLPEFQISKAFSSDSEGESYFVTTSFDIGFKLIPRETKNNEIFEFIIEVSGATQALHFSFEMYLLNKSSDAVEIIPAISHSSNATYESSMFSTVISFSVNDILKSCIFDGNLYIEFNCKRYSLVHLTDITNSACPTLPASFRDTDIWIEDLGSDFARLLLSGYLSDVTLRVASNRPFKLHRSMLAARSDYFFKQLLHNEHRSNFEFTLTSEVASRIIGFMFMFIYSGKVFNVQLNKRDILDLYEAAEIYSVSSLKIRCQEYLCMNLDDESFVNDVALKAEKYNNSFMLKQCSQFYDNRSGYASSSGSGN